jgi:tRNA(Ile)-lysidine synthase
MKNDISSFLKAQLLSFLDHQGEGLQPILLGYSGGADSQALFHLLLDVKRFRELDLHLIHVDHQWRPSSTCEANYLKDYAQRFHVPFHLVTLDPTKIPPTDIENYFRQQRLEAFYQVYKSINAGCLMLAHHEDDLAETVFKRLFEGACLTKLAGLKAKTHLHHMIVLRPLLGCEKQQLLTYLKIHKLEFIEDSTNQDTTYLRSRQRQKIFPAIESLFGKNASKNLSKIAKKSAYLELYLEEKTKKYKHHILQGPFGWACDFTQEAFQPLEWEYFLKQNFKTLGLSFSYDTLEDLMDKLRSFEANKRFISKNLEVVVDRGWVFVHSLLLPQKFPDNIIWDGKFCAFESEDFYWQLTPIQQVAIESSWKDLYIGEVTLELEEGHYQLKDANHDKKAQHKGFSQCKVPSFLRSLAPIFLKDKQVLSNPWIKTHKKLKEKKGAKLVCWTKNGGILNFRGLKSTPLLSSKS